MKLLLNAAGLPVAGPTNDKFLNTIGMTFNLISAGEFMMGSSDADVQGYLKSNPQFSAADYAKREQPQHQGIRS